jgi:hypothetical protein
MQYYIQSEVLWTNNSALKAQEEKCAADEQLLKREKNLHVCVVVGFVGVVGHVVVNPCPLPLGVSLFSRFCSSFHVNFFVC